LINASCSGYPILLEKASVVLPDVPYNDPMRTISVQDIQRDLFAFLRRVEAGESFLVVSGEHPLAEVRPVAAPARQARPFGLCTGQFTVPADFDRPLPEGILKEFEGA
jgi:antitoxin (DNA-binding transcriptional repressor) of toxin-antitoxin stability system